MNTHITRTSRYFGQEATITGLRQMFAEIRTHPVCRVAYIEAAGGLGKSFLQVKLADLLERPSALISQPIDLSDPDTRVGSLISMHLIDALKERLPDTSSDPFAAYQAALKLYYEDRVKLSTREIDRRREALNTILVADLNHLAQIRPLVICLDTAEALISPSPEGQLRAIISKLNQDTVSSKLADPSTLDEFFDWFDAVIAQLTHTLVVVCGRPLSGNQPTFFDSLTSRWQGNEHLQAKRYELKPLNDKEIAQLLQDEWQGKGDSQLGKVDIDEAIRFSEGYPLLATIYLELRHRPSHADLAQVRGRGDFQRYLLEKLLDPLAPRVPFTQQMVAYGLYALVHARRGLTEAELKEFLYRYHEPDTLSPQQEHDLEQALKDLHLDAMVKYREQSQLLLLHDEILVLLDQSGMSDVLDIKSKVQDYLIELAQRQLHAAEAEHTSSEGRRDYLRAMNNLIYYQLEKSPDRGYREYLRIMLDLFNRRETFLPLILRDDLWRWLNQPVSISGRSGSTYTNRDRLGRGDIKLEIAEIQRDDAVWLVKYYLTRNELDQAVRLGKRLWEINTDHEDDYYTFDLALTLGRAMVLRYDQDVVADNSEQILSKAVNLAANAQKSRQIFFRDRWTYFHGTACTMVGYRWRTLFDFARAADMYEQGRASLRAYAAMPNHDLDVAEALAQVEINLAYLLSKSGNSGRAAQMMRANIIAPEFQGLSQERQAIIYNVASIAETERGILGQAKDYVSRAWNLALKSGSKRIIAQVALQRGVVSHESMKLSDDYVDLPARESFRDAVARFQSEKTSLRETELEYARYLRTCALISRRKQALADAQTFLADAAKHLQRAKDALNEDPIAKDIPTIPKAEIQVEQAFQQRIQGEYHMVDTMLKDAEQTLVHVKPMPRNGLIVAATICFEQAWLKLETDDAVQAAVMCIATLAHSRSFSITHRSIKRFTSVLSQDFPDQTTPILQVMSNTVTTADPIAPLLPDVVSQEKWLREWEEAREQIQTILQDVLYARH